MSIRLDAIGFDLDGTLWDGTETVAKTWKRVCEKDARIKKVPQMEDIQGIMGLTVEEISGKLFPELTLEQGLEVIDICCQEEVQDILAEGGRLFDGLAEVLEELSRKYKLYIVSNCNPGYIEAFLEHHQLAQYFCDHEDHGSTMLPKGENIRLVMERNHFESSIYVGDTPGDCKAAREAGIPFIHAAYGFGEVEGGWQLHDIRELPRLVEDLLAQGF
ncbi:MAG: HAD family hydrolase [Firmicutes bacterium]|nr:HAD family hydrolase [Bacillota bacterium]